MSASLLIYGLLSGIIHINAYREKMEVLMEHIKESILNTTKGMTPEAERCLQAYTESLDELELQAFKGIVSKRLENEVADTKLLEFHPEFVGMVFGGYTKNGLYQVFTYANKRTKGDIRRRFRTKQIATHQINRWANKNFVSMAYKKPDYFVSDPLLDFDVEDVVAPGDVFFTLINKRSGLWGYKYYQVLELNKGGVMELRAIDTAFYDKDGYPELEAQAAGVIRPFVDLRKDRSAASRECNNASVGPVVGSFAGHRITKTLSKGRLHKSGEPWACFELDSGERAVKKRKMPNGNFAPDLMGCKTVKVRDPYRIV